jgi:hypothetical protein
MNKRSTKFIRILMRMTAFHALQEVALVYQGLGRPTSWAANAFGARSGKSDLPPWEKLPWLYKAYCFGGAG